MAAGGSDTSWILESLKAIPEMYTCEVCAQQIFRIEYDGASKGNPGPAGAGALIRRPNGVVSKELRVGLGTATNNVAEYVGLIAGLRAALHDGLRCVRVQGDSLLVTQQVKGDWEVRKKHLLPYHREAIGLLKSFDDSQIIHVDRIHNHTADRLATEATSLPAGKIEHSLPDYCEYCTS